ncbi:YrhB domain-containing protein [Kitasatospora terrestris]|uniref:Immunity protein 35 domain-containing protein n=1 Tax=Kitasatospora terrestris TaxID=258051 RepID=A0ABP9D8P9_9ACTN
MRDVITEERAVALVEALLAQQRQQNPWLARLSGLAVSGVGEHELCWVVSWQSLDYLRSGNFSDLLVGHGPYLVDRLDGSIHYLTWTGRVDGSWERPYLEHVRGVPAEQPRDLVADGVAALVRSDGTVAAMRHLRRQAPALRLQQAKAYVAAVRDGREPPEDLAALTRRPVAEPTVAVHTVAGPDR